MRNIRFAQAPVHRWKNGGGVTRMIARMPAAGDGYGEDLLWNVSIPEIASSGPFSALDGFDRQFLILDGAGVELTCSNASPRIEFTKRCDKPLELFAFQGEWKTHCTLLGGTVNDLSVITRRGQCGARIEILELRDTIAIEKAAGDDCVILVATGAAKVLAHGRADELGRFDSIVGDRGAYASYSLSKVGLAPTQIVVVRLSPA